MAVRRGAAETAALPGQRDQGAQGFGLPDGFHGPRLYAVRAGGSAGGAEFEAGMVPQRGDYFGEAHGVVGENFKDGAVEEHAQG